jgi:hypothetical protein
MSNLFLKTSVADPDLISGAFLPQGSGSFLPQGSGIRIRILDPYHVPNSIYCIFKILPLKMTKNRTN